mmetsp:Transcript_36554/g.112636  ORF Transcript_36554/g.112636 Transcript_36554/m.112636 type:complete len:254 (+) Transcript_36554:350-1111(+)
MRGSAEQSAVVFCRWHDCLHTRRTGSHIVSFIGLPLHVSLFLKRRYGFVTHSKPGSHSERQRGSASHLDWSVMRRQLVTHRLSLVSQRQYVLAAHASRVYVLLHARTQPDVSESHMQFGSVWQLVPLSAATSQRFWHVRRPSFHRQMAPEATHCESVESASHVLRHTPLVESQRQRLSALQLALSRYALSHFCMHAAEVTALALFCGVTQSQMDTCVQLPALVAAWQSCVQRRPWLSHVQRESALQLVSDEWA